MDANRYHSTAVAYLEKSTGKRVSMGRLAVRFYPHITIRVDDFAVMSPSPFPPSDILKVARIDTRFDGWALLRRQIVITSMVLEQPLVNLVWDPDGGWNFESPHAKTKINVPPIGVIGGSPSIAGICWCQV